MEDELEINLEECNIDISIETRDSVETEIESNEEVKINSVKDYNKLENLPQIEGVELKGNKTFQELGLAELTNSELEQLLT